MCSICAISGEHTLRLSHSQQFYRYKYVVCRNCAILLNFSNRCVMLESEQGKNKTREEKKHRQIWLQTRNEPSHQNYFSKNGARERQKKARYNLKCWTEKKNNKTNTTRGKKRVKEGCFDWMANTRNKEKKMRKNEPYSKNFSIHTHSNLWKTLPGWIWKSERIKRPWLKKTFSFEFVCSIRTFCGRVCSLSSFTNFFLCCADYYYDHL